MGDTLYFVEPHPAGGTCFVRLSKQQVIEWQRKSGFYPSDEEALEDFKVIHMAEESPNQHYLEPET